MGATIIVIIIIPWLFRIVVLLQPVAGRAERKTEDPLNMTAAAPAETFGFITRGQQPNSRENNSTQADYDSFLVYTLQESILQKPWT